MLQISLLTQRNKEFMGIIELYRENHDKGYKENDAESFGGSKEFNKKKKRKTDNEKQAVKPLNVAVINSPPSDPQNLQNTLTNRAEIFQNKDIGRRSLVTKEERDLLENFRKTKERSKKKGIAINDFEKFLDSMKYKFKRNKSFNKSKSQTASQLNISMTQFNLNHNQKDLCKIDKVHIKSKISLNDRALNDLPSENENPKFKKDSPQRSGMPHIYSSKRSKTENLNTLESGEKIPIIASTTRGDKNILLPDGDKHVEARRSRNEIKSPTKLGYSKTTLMNTEKSQEGITKTYLNSFQKPIKQIEALHKRPIIKQQPQSEIFPDIEPNKFSASTINGFDHKTLLFGDIGNDIQDNANQLQSIKLDMLVLQRPIRSKNSRGGIKVANRSKLKTSRKQTVKSGTKYINIRDESPLKNKFAIYNQETTK